MTLCIAVGKGARNAAHFIFRDIDREICLADIELESEAWLIYSTHGKQAGAHFVAGLHYPVSKLVLRDAAMLKDLADSKAPHNAIRIYPNTDYQLLRIPLLPWSCARLARLYGAILGVDIPIYQIKIEPCEPLRFGVYRTTTEFGEKARGKDRLVP